VSTAFRGAVAAVGIGATPLYRRATAPVSERGLVVEAVVAACEDAGIAPADVDGVVSYGGDRNDGPRLTASLGTRELRLSAMNWGSGGGGVAGALQLAASAIITGQAERVVVVRALAEQRGGRLSRDVTKDHLDLHYRVNGVESPAQICALRTRRLLEQGLPPETLYAIAAAGYHHARANPGAVGRDAPFDREVYAASRMISEPLRLHDCSRENDGAAAVLLVAADRAADLTDRPAYLLSAPSSAGEGWGDLGENVEPYDSGGFRSVARRLWSESGAGPSDVDVVQVYDSFTGPAVAALIDHGFCDLENAGEVLTVENLTAPLGGLPLNTAGGNVAEGFIHGMSLVLEAVRQIQGRSTNQVPGADLSLVISGPEAPLPSSALFGSERTR
jgi:acetyl-CoA acetyltransferase